MRRATIRATHQAYDRARRLVWRPSTEAEDEGIEDWMAAGSDGPKV